jgi:outer membrane protein TolC
MIANLQTARGVPAAIGVLGLLLAATPAAGGGSGPDAGAVPLTLAEAVARARTASATLRELDARLAAAEADRRLAAAGRAPEITARAGYARLSDVPELTLFEPGVGARTLFPNIPDNYRAAIDLTAPLYTGGRIAARIDSAERKTDAARHDLAAGGADLILEVTAAYWELTVAREREAVLARAIASFDAHLADARNLLRFGMAARNDVLAVEVERHRAELESLSAAAGARIAAANLSRLLDLPPGSRVELADPLASSTAEAGSPNDLVAEALAARPERRGLAALADAAAARVRLERGDRRPRLAATAGYLYARPNRNVLPFEDRFDATWEVALNLSFKLFDGGRRQAAEARAEAGEEALRHRLEDLERRIRLEVTSRRVELDTALAAVEVAEGGVEAARENLRVASDRFREGLVPSSERLDAETALLGAELDRTSALAAARLARARLERSLGR